MQSNKPKTLIIFAFSFDYGGLWNFIKIAKFRLK